MEEVGAKINKIMRPRGVVEYIPDPCMCQPALTLPALHCLPSCHSLDLSNALSRGPSPTRAPLVASSSSHTKRSVQQ